MQKRRKPICIGNENGGSLVEFALVLPLLLILVGGIVDFSILFYNKQVLANACREGARAGIVNVKDSSNNKITVSENDVALVVMNYLEGDGGESLERLWNVAGNATITVTARNALNAGITVDNLNYPDDLKVTITLSDYSLLLAPLLNILGASLGDMDLSAYSIMKME
jgi:Flp pilus assembly protein TadG